MSNHRFQKLKCSVRIVHCNPSCIYTWFHLQWGQKIYLSLDWPYMIIGEGKKISPILCTILNIVLPLFKFHSDAQIFQLFRHMLGGNSESNFNNGKSSIKTTRAIVLGSSCCFLIVMVWKQNKTKQTQTQTFLMVQSTVAVYFYPGDQPHILWGQFLWDIKKKKKKTSRRECQQNTMFLII